tara:strand:+ start:2265 stop:2975 length:711 start_codon:yes stop_codon:yes gene_type:complete
MGKIVKFKSIKFYDYSFKYIYKRLLNCGGYVVAPAASSLSEIIFNKRYYYSLRNSDIAIFDSGFFCILLRIFKQIKVKKLSGYLFLKLLLEEKNIKNKKFFLINPSQRENIKNFNLLRSKGVLCQRSLIAPVYNMSNYKDLGLINMINSYNPDILIINLGGGIQEPLAAFIKQKSKKKKLIILCTGAAISFLTKEQAPISEFYDKYYLGWMIRLIHRPKSYFPRVIKSLSMIKYFK